MLKRRSPLFSALVMLVLCASVMVGATYAQYTAKSVTANDTISGADFGASLSYLDGSEWKTVQGGALYSADTRWEPGYTDLQYVKIGNEGELAYEYWFDVQPQSSGDSVNLMDVIDVYFGVLGVFGEGETVPNLPNHGEYSSFAAYKQDMNLQLMGTLTELKTSPQIWGTLAAEKNAHAVLAMQMKESAGNEYMGARAGEFALKFTAKQMTVDEGFAHIPDDTITQESGAAQITDAMINPDGTLNQAVSLTLGDRVSVYVPAGVLLEKGVKQLKVTVFPVANSNANVTMEQNEEQESIDVHVSGVSAQNTVPLHISIKELMDKGLNIGNYQLYHVENNQTNEMTGVTGGANIAHNTFAYVPETGDTTLYMATFSEVAMVADKENAWNGEFDYSWYTNAVAPVDGENEEAYTIANADQLAAFGAIVGGMAEGIDQDSFSGKTVKLLADINLGDAEAENNPDLIFYPIGYNSSDGKYEKTGVAVTTGFYNFSGTFDGNGHTISNFYQNTWEMKGDHNWYDATLQYYKDGMGLFGKVYKGTVKNLTVSNFSSDGEIATTGVIAAYADGATFENIAITDCNPRVYNIGNGGIVGCVGWYAKEANLKTTFTNITVDNTNKISALWGSYDVPCGGLVGQYYPTSGQTSAGTPKNAGIEFVNCHVSAIMDVYNDVCANYQYYAYRYAGMIIGSIRENTTNEDGKTIPDMTGISASGCTVNYGDWNDYYYCEFETNGHPSYSEQDDYKFSRVPHSELNFTDSNGNGLVDADERASVTGCKHNHTDAENNKAIYLPFHQLFTGNGWGVNSIGLEKYSGIVTNLDITEGDQEESVEKFETKFTGDFLYRVGNKGTVALGSLFAAKDGATISNSGVVASIDKVDKNSNVSGTFTANITDWTKGTIQFSGTGVVKVTIQDYNFCKPTVLYLEVVDAVNATGATSATSNNVVLLNDADFGSLEVSGGYTLYGNGFKMTCDSDSPALDTGYSFVTLNNGTLDNVQIVCPNFDYAVLYKSNMTESGNRSQTTDKTRYYNVKSGVMVSGNSQILNSRISGARAAVNVTGGNLLIDNSRIELGAVASLLVGAANKLTLRDVTLVQKPTASTYDPSKTLMGFSVLFVCDAEGNVAPVTLEGKLVQNAWVNESDKQYVPSDGQSIINNVLGKTDYLHDLNGDGKNESLNLGFAYMPESLTSKVNTTTITDNRANKDAVPYDYAEVSIFNGKTYVYSYKNTNGTVDSFKNNEEDYVPNKQGDTITVTYSDTTDGLESSKSFGTDGWVYELNVDLDKASGYKLDFSKLSMSVNGVAVTDFKVNGENKPTSLVAVTAGGVTYTLSATVNGKEYTATYKVTGTETSKESPSKISGPTAAGFGVATSYGGDWSGAADVLTGVKIKYWSVAENKYVEFDFSNFTVPGNAGKLNKTNNYWEYTHTNNDFTLKVTNTVAIHSGKSVYGMPIRGTDGKLYFTISSTNGYVGTGTGSRAITMQYEFTDNNGGEKLTFTHTFNISYNKDNQYSYSDLSGSGKLTKLESTGGSSGGTCVTPDTLITLADGSQVRMDSLTGDEQLLVWNMETGKLDAAPIMFLDSDPEADYEVVRLCFSDGTDVKVIYEHGFWDYDLNRYVYLDKDAAQYIGHSFYKLSGDSGEKVQLTDVVIETETTTAWSPVTAGHLCYFVNGMLSMPGGVGGLFNIFDVDPATMTYDPEAMARDIETYGLYTYDELNAIVELPEAMFDAAGGAYMKISIGKGNLTMDELIAMIQRYTKFF